MINKWILLDSMKNKSWKFYVFREMESITSFDEVYHIVASLVITKL